MLASISTLLCGVTLVSGFTAARRAPDVIRTRGIVIVDAQGRDRILIGAPIPASHDRIRGDFAKAKQAWGKRYPDFEWYRGLEHSTNGIVVLDPHGYDRIVLGDPTPDPNIGKRAAPASGIAVNDTNGFERSGWGYFPSLDRTILGVDTPGGTEGVMVGVLDDSTAGVIVMQGGPAIFLGNAGPGHPLTGLTRPFNGLLIRQGDAVKFNLNAREEK
jgi:hypothetical protein